MARPADSGRQAFPGEMTRRTRCAGPRDRGPSNSVVIHDMPGRRPRQNSIRATIARAPSAAGLRGMLETLIGLVGPPGLAIPGYS